MLDPAEKAVAHLSGLLSTLREHRVSNIRLVALSPSPDPRGCGLPVLEAWECLDQILYKLGGQAQGRGETLTFQSVSVATKEHLGELLPRFNRIGICEEVAR